MGVKNLLSFMHENKLYSIVSIEASIVDYKRYFLNKRISNAGANHNLVLGIMALPL